MSYDYAIVKSATHAPALQMAERSEIPASSTVVTILPKIIDTPMNRKYMTYADNRTWAPLDKIAQMVKGCAQGEKDLRMARLHAYNSKWHCIPKINVKSLKLIQF